MKKPCLIMLAVFLCTLMLCSCIVLPAAPVKEAAPPVKTEVTAIAITESPSPVPTATAAPTEPIAATPTPVPPKIEYTTVNNTAAQKFMQVQVGAPLSDALAILGNPVKIYGEGSYNYRAIAAGEASQPASIYRFSVDGLPIELIVGQSDCLVLKKQISSPAVFGKLLESASIAQLADGVPYAEALKQLGKNPYLWMEFTLPNPTPESDTYQVVIWPDKNGQFAAVIKDAVVLRSEYQPNDIVLGAAAADGITPRVPRYLKPLPKNANKRVTAYSSFKMFSSMKINASEQTVLSAFGSPTSTDDSNPDVHILTFEIANAEFANAKTVFTFTFTTGESSLLMAKKAVVLPVGETDIRARYAPQMLSNMKKSEIERFMGKGFLSDQRVNADGRILDSYSFAGEKACVIALFPQGDDTAIGNDCALYDTEAEAATLYEEYVIVLPTGAKSTTKPKPSPTPTPTTPAQTRPPIKTRPPVVTPTPTPKPTLHLFTKPPIFTLRPLLPTPTPAPTIQIIK